ncbi:caspase family protein [Hyalangium rubrum]|uniref:Caspase family protein n=1 Tax=Hyalangium rubrum TaxID=3103134 RepID=A0ABU5H8U2_9BACT|nr:caspase family protein [Hyalangium sp. s54d21]MDY7229721.1 caspase family protein [Hyalangium sp. s54d21]
MSRGSLALTLALVALPALAEERPRAAFAFIVGVNQSVDPNEPALRYADDDAARYLDLFRLLGARTYLLARLDENTERLHPQAAAEASAPRWAEWQRLVDQLAHDVEQARARDLGTVIYFVYAGHGSVRNGQGYVTLEDRRLTGRDLAEGLIERVKADQAHLIVDACSSYFLAYGRGPGGQRRPLQGFSEVARLSDDGRVGLLLSTSSVRESHEWEAFQAGVFSHEVRSGLYGAADADGDGRVSYKEIAAFVERANAAIPNERFRPEVHARPPKDGQWLVELGNALEHRIEVDGREAMHLRLEDSKGVRLADFHNASGQRLWVARPIGTGPLYVRRVVDGQEYRIDAMPQVVQLAALTPQAPRVGARGAEHEAFSLIFSLPYDRQTVDTYDFRMPVLIEPAESTVPAWRRVAGWSAVGLAGASLGGGVWTTMSARGVRSGGMNGLPQAEVMRRNQRIQSLNRRSTTLYAAGAVAGAVGLGLLLWPGANAEAAPVVGPGTAGLQLGGQF